MDQHIRLHHILRSAVIAVERAGERRPALPTALLAPTPDLATSIVVTSAQSVEPLEQTDQTGDADEMDDAPPGGQ